MTTKYIHHIYNIFLQKQDCLLNYSMAGKSKLYDPLNDLHELHTLPCKSYKNSTMSKGILIEFFLVKIQAFKKNDSDNLGVGGFELKTPGGEM